MILLKNESTPSPFLTPLTSFLYPLSTILLLLVFSCSSRTSSEIDLVGKWIVSEDGNEELGTDIWQFEANGNCCELKGNFDGDTSLRCDEKGNWKLKENILITTFTEENGKKFQKPQVIKFKIKKDNGNLLLTIIKDKNGYGINMEDDILRLSPYDP